MNKKKWDTFGVGFFSGLIGPVFGFLIYGLYWSNEFGETFTYFVNTVFLGTSIYQPSIISLSLLANLALFLLSLRLDFNQIPRGILGATFVYAPVIIILKFV